MPHMSGPETSERLRKLLGQSLEKHKRTKAKARRPFICGITALSRGNIKQISKESGMDDLLIKPIEDFLLEEILDRAGIRD